MQELANAALNLAAPKAAKNTSQIEDANRYAHDRLDRLEHVLDDLNATVMHLGSKLSPVLTGGTYGAPADPAIDIDGSGSPEDPRSPVAREFAALADHADRLASAANGIRRLVEALDDATEL